jgi:hypothetical protein
MVKDTKLYDILGVKPEANDNSEEVALEISADKSVVAAFAKSVIASFKFPSAD